MQIPRENRMQSEHNEGSLSMDVEAAIRNRRSVRGYTSQRVPTESMRHVFDLARWAPSNCNIQPWRVYVASEGTRDRIRDAMLEQFQLGVAPNPDFDYPAKFDEPYRHHQIACAVTLYNHMGIGRDDKEGRSRAALRNFELFDAPHVAFVGMDRRFKEAVALDLGIYLQTIMLAMTAAGIACCPQGSMRNYPDIVRREFGVSSDIGILVGLSFGYEDPSVPANRTRIDRAPFSENVVFKSD